MIPCLNPRSRRTTRQPIEFVVMDIPRFALIAASIFLSLMLVGEWSAFKARQEPQMQTHRLTQMDSTVDSMFETSTNGPVASDIDGLVPELPQAPTERSVGGLVTVTTPKLALAISLLGGDIVEVALPAFPESLDTPDVPFVVLEDNSERTYIAQSGLVGKNGIDAPTRARFASAETHYDITSGDGFVDLSYLGDNPEISITKRFSFSADSYAVTITWIVDNDSLTPWSARPFAQLKRDSSLAPGTDTGAMGMRPFLGAALTQPDERFTKFTFDEVAEEPFKKALPGGWIAMVQHYFISAWIPSPDQQHLYSTRQSDNGINYAGLVSPELIVAPGSTGSSSATLYVGPKDQYALAELAPHLDLTVDYGWLWWVAQPLFWLLTNIHAAVGNWGVAIILLTVLVKTLFFRLSAASYRSMARMRKVQPKLVALREQHADDKQKQSQAMMELYKKEGINPMGGCLPILIQMPVFIALYWVLMESVELRQAPFALWIHDLAAMDPYYVLPLLMGGSMFFMQKLNPPPPDPMQAKIMQWMPVVFTFFFLWFPAGLVLYWVVNNLLSMAQQFVITRSIEREGLKH
jgi:YidC/Oxa1 family membrane protein insertase